MNPNSTETDMIRTAMRIAAAATAHGDVPVGAVIIDGSGQVIASGHNTRERDGDILGHAEINAITAAIRHTGSRVLDDCTLFITLEPCAMCAAVIASARIPRVVFGAWDDKAGAAGSVYDLLRDGRLPHPVPEVVGGVLADECARQLSDFFSGLRPSRS